MTTKIDKDGNKLQFISDENDIETIMNKLDQIIDKQNKEVADMAISIITHLLEYQDKKLDWIAYRLMRLTLALGEGMNGNEIDEYSKLFKSVPQEIPKE